MKKLIITLLIALIFFPHLTLANEKVSADYIIPSDLTAGETVQIKWKLSKHNPKKPAFIYLQNTETELFSRLAVGRNQANEYSVLNWNIPKDLSGEYRLRISHQINGKWLRKRSQTFNISSQPTEKPTTNTIDTSATITTPKIEVEHEILPEFSSITINGSETVKEGLTLAARYQFSAQYEPWMIQRLTIVNDSQNDGFEVDPNESSRVIKEVFIRYKNKEDQLVEKKSSLGGNKTTFSSLDFYVPKDQSAEVEIWARVKDQNEIDKSLTGESFKLGVQSINNDQSSFEANGEYSGNQITSPSSFSNQSSNKTFIVRKSAPFMEIKKPTTPFLIEGENSVFHFSINASAESPISLGRIVFIITQNNINQIDQVRLTRQGKTLNPGDENQLGQVYLKWDAGAQSCFAHTKQNGINTGMNCNGGTSGQSKLILTFTEEEIISDTTQYELRLQTKGMSKSASLQVKIEDRDENQAPNLGGTGKATGSIFNNLGGNEWFSNSTDYVNEADTANGRSLIWSDHPLGSQHQYPTFTPSLNPSISNNSSADFANGYLLNLDELMGTHLEN